MIELCHTVSVAVSSISSLDELDGFVETIKRHPDATKTPTSREWEEIARKRIEFQKRRT
jgi:hypothetical protein